MENYNKEKENKGGFWSVLSGLFRGGSSAMGGASSGLGTAGSSASGLAGLFATKAGILGMVLGGATIAAGVGVVYNFVSPSSKGVYSPELFQNSYYEEESTKASLDRASSRDSSAASASTLDIFKEQARKDGLGGLAAEAGEADKAAADAAAENPGGASADSAAPGAPGAGSETSAAAPKLQASSGFGGSKGGGSSGTSIPRMQGGGGLSGGIGNQFQSVYRPPANTGKSSAMNGAMASRVNSSPKYSVPNFNKKGAYGQAKYAGKMGAKAAYSADGAGARTSAENAFTGETTGSGDVGAAGTGAGLGGAGVSKGSALKGNDPSLSSNESTPPKVKDVKTENPWQAIEDGIMKDMMWAGGLILLTKLLSGIAKKLVGPWAVGFYLAAMAAAIAAIVFAVKVLIGGIKLYQGDPNGNPAWAGQHMMGGIYIAVGVMLIIQAIKALCEAAEGAANATDQASNAAGNQVDAKGNEIMKDGTKPVVDSAGKPVVDAAGKPVMQQVPVEATKTLGGGFGKVLGGIGNMGSIFDIIKL